MRVGLGEVRDVYDDGGDEVAVYVDEEIVVVGGLGAVVVELLADGDLEIGALASALELLVGPPADGEALEATERLVHSLVAQGVLKIEA